MKYDFCIIGAGLSGLAAAQQLIAQGQNVQILDKSSTVGGRLATRRIGARSFDHGAQYFTVRTTEFAEIVNEWQAAGVVYEWCRSFESHLAQPGLTGSGHPRYVCTGGMNSIAKALAAKLPSQSLALGYAVKSIKADGTGGWEMTRDGHDAIRATRVIMTVPVPQAGPLILNAAAREIAERYAREVDFAPTLALLVSVSKEAAQRLFPEAGPGGAFMDQSVLSFAADNYRKGVSSTRGAITIHATTAFSQAHYASGDAEVASLMLAAAGVGEADMESPWQLKRWRYAVPLKPLNCGSVALDEAETLILTGDAFSGARVEGAWCAGRHAARRFQLG